MRLSFLLGILLILSACTTAVDMRTQWEGKPFAIVKSSLGEPDVILPKQEGHTLYGYYAKTALPPPEANENRTMVFVGPNGRAYGVVTPSPHPPVDTGLRCVTWFDTNNKNIVLSVQHEGNNCLETST